MKGLSLKIPTLILMIFKSLDRKKTDEEGTNNTLINFGTLSSNNELLIKKRL